MTYITPTQHEKDEWSRMAREAYFAGYNWTGHRYSTYASISRQARLPVHVFDSLQHNYRHWLLTDEYPQDRKC